ncbi:LYR motif-containing protein 4 [Coemansia reversa NRRL 1564]|uniref:LYR motif-containing protein 4 n=1 Tax=Coemansia reversa (strain ATCC 12441 / NRRL 1564) TaxID=763665 RepID=A0A2G5BER0_COERN|nr:LYR motif-containing protein 4 [Coemansia reversa NRRL 1564]|eukprot:PIA17505.1 LYR motif-containing protein 4 [Coemansia reversa NRRL 1564]
MSTKQSQILHLYRSSLRAAQRFETYNFRKYFYRRTHDRFHTMRNETDSRQVEKAMAEARAELEVMQRQGILNKMFSHNRTVIESDPHYASGARRFAV